MLTIVINNTIVSRIAAQITAERAFFDVMRDKASLVITFTYSPPCAGITDNTAILNSYPSRGHLCQFLVVGNHHNRLRELFIQVRQRQHNTHAGFGIQIACRLVGKNNVRLGNQCTCNRRSLLLTA